MKTAANKARMADAWARALNNAPLCYRPVPAPSQVRLRIAHAQRTQKKRNENMSDQLAGIKNAAAAAGIQIEREHARLVAEDRDRWKLQARIARAVAAAGWVLLIGALLSK